MFRSPSLRNPLDLLYLFACVLLTAVVIVPEVWGAGKTKDYSLWYWAGQQVLNGGPLYPTSPGDSFDFLYPPLAAILMAIPSALGKLPFYLVLCFVNAAAWWITSQLSNAMTGSDKIPGPWLAALPGFATISFTYDMFDLGQPNLLLLAMMLSGFWLLWHRRPMWGGAMFALATAIKVFPVAVLPYLLWRRRWVAAGSMIAWLGILLVVVPAPIRGNDQNLSELATWYRGMVGTSSEKGFGQRDEQNWSWINQSIIAVTHRLVRPVNYNQDNPSRPVQTMNVADVSFKTANLLVLAVSGLIGLAFIAVLLPLRQTTPRSDAEELGILLCLITIASPLARQYYFIWLFFPLTVLMHRAAFDPREAVRKATVWALCAAGAFMVLSLPLFPKLFQALGNNLAATAVIVGMLAWHMHNPPNDSTVIPGRE